MDAPKTKVLHGTEKTVPASFHLLDGWMVGDIPHIYQHLHQDDPFTIYPKNGAY
jgi:hypothetical protein